MYLAQGAALLREHASSILPGLAELVGRDRTDNALRVSLMHMLADIVHGACATHDDAVAVGAMLQPQVGELLAALAKLAKLPFTDVKHAAMHLLEALGARPWALPALCETPGLLDRLLDAETAAAEDRDDGQWRYSVLRAILSCEGAEGIVGSRTVSLLYTYGSGGTRAHPGALVCCVWLRLDCRVDGAQTYVQQVVARGDRTQSASGGAGRQRPAPQVKVATRSGN